MEFGQILELIQAVSDSNLTSFCYEADGTAIKIKTNKETKSPAAALSGAPFAGVPGQPPQPVPFAAAQGQPPQPVPFAAAQGQPPQQAQFVAAQGQPPQPAPLPTAPPSTEYSAIAAAAEENFVKSPLVGTFYAAPSPEEEPYVKIGDTVTKGQVIGIIEAMKLMNEIESEKDGVVKSILVKNGDVIEYGQPLFIIE